MAADDWYPGHWGHPQFDHENAMAWGQFVKENPYVENQGRLWTPNQWATTSPEVSSASRTSTTTTRI